MRCSGPLWLCVTSTLLLGATAIPLPSEKQDGDSHLQEAATEDSSHTTSIHHDDRPSLVLAEGENNQYPHRPLPSVLSDKTSPSSAGDAFEVGEDGASSSTEAVGKHPEILLKDHLRQDVSQMANRSDPNRTLDLDDVTAAHSSSEMGSLMDLPPTTMEASLAPIVSSSVMTSIVTSVEDSPAKIPSATDVDDDDDDDDNDDDDDDDDDDDEDDGEATALATAAALDENDEDDDDGDDSHAVSAEIDAYSPTNKNSEDEQTTKIPSSQIKETVDKGTRTDVTKTAESEDEGANVEEKDGEETRQEGTESEETDLETSSSEESDEEDGDWTSSPAVKSSDQEASASSTSTDDQRRTNVTTFALVMCGIVGTTFVVLVGVWINRMRHRERLRRLFGDEDEEFTVFSASDTPGGGYAPLR